MISPTELRAAADAIRDGRLVAFPTETVYGLGANALDATAVARIFAVKGRPSTSPLIVHVADAAGAQELVRNWPENAHKLADRFWPGPLTLVLPKRQIIPDIVTAGLDTVGVRVPANSTALAFLRECALPVAAPSANRFTELSPTSAEHVRRSLGTQVEIILDDGPTMVGLESTVISLAAERPCLLRPGMITAAQIEELIGPLEEASRPGEGAHASPGMHPRHYQPRTRLLIASRESLPLWGRGIFLSRSASEDLAVFRMPATAPEYAARIYSALHELDEGCFDWIAVEPLPPGHEWDAIRDRLSRAAHLD